MIKSPLRYPGGKSKAINIISELVPEFQEYREPFVGGGSLFVYLKQAYPNRKFWINDIYENLFHFWNECKNQPDNVISQILIWKNEFSEGKKLHRYLIENIDTFDNLKKAAAFFVFNRITFSGTTESGGFSDAAFHKRFTQTSIERVERLSMILSDTKITNTDYQKVINYPGKNVFIFLDPPYYSATKSALYGKNGNLHKSFDHFRFSEIMRNVSYKWLITYDDSEYIKELFSFANIISWDLTYGMRNVNKSSNPVGKELFISNYEIDNKELEQTDLFSSTPIKR